MKLERFDPPIRNGLRFEIAAVNRLKAIKIRALVRSGKTWKDAAYPFCVTADRVRQMVAMLERPSR